MKRVMEFRSNILKKIIFCFCLLFSLSSSFSQSFSEVQKVVPTGRTQFTFGNIIEISGDYAVVGTINGFYNNAVYIFKKDDSGKWNQIQKLETPENAILSSYGYSLDIYEDYIIIGDFFYQIVNDPFQRTGFAYIYKKNSNGLWELKQRLRPSDSVDGASFGFAVSIHKGQCVVGSTRIDGSRGCAYIFEENDFGIWTEKFKIQPADIAIQDVFGYYVSISDSTLVVATPYQDTNETGGNYLSNAGSVYIFNKNTSGVWIESQKIVAHDRSTDGYFGSSLSHYDRKLIIGSGSLNMYFDNVYYISSGAYIYEKNSSGLWEFVQKLSPPDPANPLGFGNSVGLSGDYAAVSAIDEREDNAGNVLGEFSGAVYIYKRQANGTWDSIQRIVSSDIAAGDHFGRSLAMEGNQLIVGAYEEDEDENGQNTIDRAGSAYVFELCPPVRDTISQTMCDSYQWQGNTYTQSGMYEFTTIASTGCDSIITLDLTILPHSTSESSDSSCTPYTWNATTYTQSGTYTYQTISSNGCDSIATLHLTIHPSSESEANINACDTYVWNGNTYTDSGTYTYQTLNAVGCDSTATLHLTIYPSYADTAFVTTCDSYFWNGNTYSSDGIYSLQAQSTHGCDSISTLVLNIQNTIETEENITACDQYDWNGNTYTQSGEYTYQTTSSSGCDSIVTLYLDVFPSVTTQENISACDSLIWQNQILTTSGMYTHQEMTIQGCDSTTQLFLTILPSTTSQAQIQACESYEWNGQTYTSSGLYTYQTNNHVGCDSTAHLDLTIHPKVENIINVSTCNPYEWNGETYTQSGVYSITQPSQFGCDSTTNLQLTIHPTYQNSLSLSACTEVEYQNNTYTTSGMYLVPLQSVFGCDSIINLTVNINAQSFEESQSACDSFYWPRSQEQYYESGIYEAVFMNAQGCDSTYQLTLEILPSYRQTESKEVCETYTWPNNQQTYTQSGIYTIQTQTQRGCDSIQTLDLTIYEGFRKRDTIVADSSYTWPVNGITYDTPGEYEARYLNGEGCDSIHYLVLRIESTYTIQFPNIITGGTNANPFKGFSNHDQVIIKELSIYDRMASRVYHVENTRVNDPNYGWNGTFRGMEVVPGVYVWMVELILPDGSIKQMAGDLTIIK